MAMNSRPDSARAAVRTGTAPVGHSGIILPVILCVATAAFLALGAVSANPVLVAATAIAGVFLAWLLWRPGEPPALLFAVGYQWLQATAALFIASVGGIPLEETIRGPEMVTATWLSLIGVVVFAIGLRLGAGRRRRPRIALMPGIAALLSPKRLAVACIVASAAEMAIREVAFLLPGLTQLMLVMGDAKWIFIFLLSLAVFQQHKHYLLLLAIMSLEVVLGMFGYFSTFKFVLLIVTLAAVTFPRTLHGRNLVVVLSVVPVVLALGIFWTGMKTEYRYFLNRGTNLQIVDVSVTDRAGKLIDLLGHLDVDSIPIVAARLFLRFSYVEYFAETLKYVPRSVPHENGALWFGTIEHIVMPRILFPDKESIDDSARTEKFTGLRIPGVSEGTSIGIGYVGESYIDFGVPLMFLPILVIGFVLGRMYWLLAIGKNPLLGYAMGTVLIAMGAYLIEMSNVKLVGGTVTFFLVMYIVQHLFGTRIMALISHHPWPERDAGIDLDRGPSTPLGRW